MIRRKKKNSWDGLITIELITKMEIILTLGSY